MSKKLIGVARGASTSLGESIEEFAAWLGEFGYAPATVIEKVRFVTELSHWMEASGISTVELDERSIVAALKRRRTPAPRNRRRAFLHFLEYLRIRGIVAPRELPRDNSPAMRLERRYVHYLREERGLAAVTVANYRGLVRSFLADRFGRGPAVLATLTPGDVGDFLLRRLRKMNPKRAQLMGSALRSFLRFSFFQTETKLDLSLAVPTVRRFRNAAVPRYLSPRDVERVISTCDRTTPIGRRNRAVLLLLARLGLRASEIVRLELGDIHWRTGELVVRGKGSVRDRLPLPKEVGEALTQYLARDRALCSSRCVFLRLRAPRRGFTSAAAVTTIVERAVDRSGLQPPLRGAHLLRHSLATGMIQRGATMAEIGQLLRHRSPNTTELYAKVDFEGLRSVSLPWIGTGGGR